ncbi:hypothetical protein SLNSH_20910 [Alsobacter soli]|uniref:Uncharacterized protein n=2 Tax=Alsobacter soli TaxID=2109933 RepID=A0A2T1HN57_9HYPH|nr:hypothetical protein SLNSH_20910 [Alsobacter soli]
MHLDFQFDWLDRPGIAVRGAFFVIPEKGLAWVRLTSASLGTIERLSQAQFLDRFEDWSLPPLPGSEAAGSNSK